MFYEPEWPLRIINYWETEFSKPGHISWEGSYRALRTLSLSRHKWLVGNSRYTLEVWRPDCIVDDIYGNGEFCPGYWEPVCSMADTPVLDTF